ncbi:hypothetical protein B7494_g2439 [Chlorociboria aeruginascens]|nr:hypothetical protein B7494_g2439 [Chlorociboria aeruginascens]
MDLHNSTVAALSSQISTFYASHTPFKVYHGSTNSTRIPSFNTSLISTSSLSHILSISPSTKTLILEPNVPMDALLQYTLPYGLMPRIVPEFPGITVGGAFNGTSAESSSFKTGFFDRGVKGVEVVRGDGVVVWARPEGENKELFWGMVGAMGTVGVTTLFELELMSTKGGWVELEYQNVASAAEAVALLSDILESENAKSVEEREIEFLDGILFTPIHGVIMIGRLVSLPSKSPHRLKVARFTRRRDPWFYLHAQKQAHRSRVLIPIYDYLFRYDRGAFWMGALSFGQWYNPFNRVTRWVYNDVMKTRTLYKMMQAKLSAQKLLVQDIAVLVENSVGFLQWVDKELGVMPLWLCPIKGDSEAPWHNLAARDGRRGQDILNIGIWGAAGSDFEEFVNVNRKLEREVKQVGEDDVDSMDTMGSDSENGSGDLSVNDKNFHLHLALLSIDDGDDANSATSHAQEELRTTPLFTREIQQIACQNGVQLFQSLFAGILSTSEDIVETKGTTPSTSSPATPDVRDPRLFLNVNAPWSAFICGSQGSGKSHTLSCMLESCLKRSESLQNDLSHPLAGIVFHYDKDSTNSICEAAYLCSMGITVDVLVSESNKAQMEKSYASMELDTDAKKPTVKVLKFKERDINVERMMSMMSVSSNGQKPLYIETITKILRKMAVEFPTTKGINYGVFKQRLGSEVLTDSQKGPLNLRIDLLESLLDLTTDNKNKYKKSRSGDAGPFSGKPGTVTIIDLSCPFIDEAAACSLFDICLALFKENTPKNIGKVIALDEAHKYMSENDTANTFTQSLLNDIRYQRHNGTRIIISTQEPTISPKLLDLCSLTIVHRFTSPRWMAMLKNHLAGASTAMLGGEGEASAQELFKKIVTLSVGEGLVFCPSAALRVKAEGKGIGDIEKMGLRWVQVRVRKRLTTDGGRSVLAGGRVYA